MTNFDLKLDLLKMDAEGHDSVAIVNDLSKKHCVSKRAVYYHLENRGKWIGKLSDTKNAWADSFSHHKYIYKQYAWLYLSSNSEYIKILALKGMSEEQTRLDELTGAGNVKNPQSIEVMAPWENKHESTASLLKQYQETQDETVKIELRSRLAQALEISSVNVQMWQPWETFMDRLTDEEREKVREVARLIDQAKAWPPRPEGMR